jgi:CubicO group peptidase (beta-lactamase class C family)
MKKLLTTACVFVVTTIAFVSFVAPTVFGQEKKSTSVKSSPTESVTAQVDKLFAQLDKPDSPGCALGIIKDGKLIYTRGYGMANLDYGIPLSSKSVFDLESISKQFTAMSILLLVNRGKLSLDDEVQKFVPELPRYQSAITIRHLINHTSGIRNHVQLAELAGMRGEDVHQTSNDYLELIARQKELNFKPGDEWVYNNSGYFLLGLIVNRVSGKSLPEFAQENIFKPLGMNHTHFHDDRSSIVQNRVSSYYPRSNGGFFLALDPYESVGAGGLYSSIEDLFLWDQNFYNNKLGGGPDLISQELSTGRLNNGESTGYAFGLGINEYKGLKRIRHGGEGSGFVHEIMRFPEQNFSVICLCNIGNVDPQQLDEQVADIFLADQFKKAPEAVKETALASPVINVPEKELMSLAGTYFDPVAELAIRRFFVRDGKLMINPYVVKESGFVLSPLGQNHFKVVGKSVEYVFVRPLAGGSMQAKEIFRGKTIRTLDAVPSGPLAFQLVDFTGEYLSDELAETTYTLAIKDGKLILQAPKTITHSIHFSQATNHDLKDIVLTPAFADTFITSISDELVTLRFTRNQQNVVASFALTTDTVRRLRFNKL